MIESFLMQVAVNAISNALSINIDTIYFKEGKLVVEMDPKNGSDTYWGAVLEYLQSKK